MSTTPFQDRHLAENRLLDNFLRRAVGAIVVQPIDQDGPPVHCTYSGCSRDAVLITRVNAATPGEYAMTACDDHTGAMLAAGVDTDKGEN